jgi:O-antigen/teichoic acid export membrane protein
MQSSLETKDKEIRQRVLVGTVSNYAGQLIAFAALFFLTPFILRHLGTTVYGLWALVSSIVAYGSLLDFGIWGAIIKYVAQYQAQSEAGQARRLIATSLTLYTLLGLAAVLLAVAVAPIFPRLFQLPAEAHQTAVWLVILMGVGVGITLPAMMPMAVLRGLQRYDLVNLIDIIGIAYTTVATVIVLLMGGGVIGLVLVNISGVLAIALPAAWLVRRVAPDLHFGWRGADRQMIRTVLNYSWPLFVRDVAGRLQTRTDEITIGAFMLISAVTPYNLARRLSEVTYILTRQFMKVLLPLASELDAEADIARLRLLYTAGTRLTLALSLAIGLCLIILARPILTLWVGPTFSQYSYLVAILTLASILAASQWPAVAVLQGMARHRILAASSLVAGVANLVLSIVLVQFLGLAGVALGTLIPAAAESFGFVLPYTARVTGLRAADLAKNILLPALLPAAPMALLLYWMREAIAPASLLHLGLIAAGGLFVYALTYFLIGAGELERQSYHHLAQSGLRFAATHLRRSQPS